MINIEWCQSTPGRGKCPACLVDGEIDPLLRVASALPPHDLINLFRCRACGSAFFPDLPAAPYETVNASPAAMAFYQEQGAGIDVMLEALYAVPHRPAARLLEIGCGFGFSLDFAGRELGWTAIGFDPGPTAALGRQVLGVDIRPTYFRTLDELGEVGFDLSLASELIEHLPAADTVLAALKAALRPDGALLLTTPNGAAATPETGPATLVPLLSPGYHAVLYSPRGLELALRRAGFRTVVIDDRGHTLRAFAAMGEAAVDFGRRLDREAYGRYLEARAGTAPPGSPLAIGMLGRLLKERLNAGRFEAAEATAATLSAMIADRWGFRPDVPDTVPIQGEPPADLAALHARHPFNLCTILHSLGMLAQLHHQRPEQAIAFFEAAHRAGEQTRLALQSVGSDDGETEELSWRARCSAYLLRARAKPDQAVLTLHDHTSAVSPLTGERLPVRLETELRRDLFIAFVASGHLAEADRIAGSVERLSDFVGEPGASAALALGLLCLNHRRAYPAAVTWFAKARTAFERDVGLPQPPASLYWAVLYHEAFAKVVAGDRAGAATVAAALLDPTPARGHPGEEWQTKAADLSRKHRLAR